MSRIDFFELAKDIMRLDCEKRGLPTPDGQLASDQTRDFVRAANQNLLDQIGDQNIQAYMTAPDIINND